MIIPAIHVPHLQISGSRSLGPASEASARVSERGESSFVHLFVVCFYRKGAMPCTHIHLSFSFHFFLIQRDGGGFFQVRSPKAVGGVERAESILTCQRTSSLQSVMESVLSTRIHRCVALLLLFAASWLTGFTPPCPVLFPSEYGLSMTRSSLWAWSQRQVPQLLSPLSPALAISTRSASHVPVFALCFRPQIFFGPLLLFSFPNVLLLLLPTWTLVAITDMCAYQLSK